MLVLVDFQSNYHSVNYQIIYLVSISRIAIWKVTIVVATTRWNGTCDMLTSAKLSVGYLVVEITRELDKEPSLHCSSIYIKTMWSVLQ